MAKFTDAIKAELKYYFLSYDRKNEKVDSEQLRKNIVATFLEAGCKLSSNERTAIMITSTHSLEQLSTLLKIYIDDMFFTFLEVKGDKDNNQHGVIEPNEEHQQFFQELIRESEIS